MAGWDVTEKGQKRKAHEKEHISNTEKIIPWFTTPAAQKPAEATADRAENAMLMSTFKTILVSQQG